MALAPGCRVGRSVSLAVLPVSAGQRAQMKATTIIKYLQRMVREHGDVNVEIETDHEIVPARKVRYEETDAFRGDTIIIQGNF